MKNARLETICKCDDDHRPGRARTNHGAGLAAVAVLAARSFRADDCGFGLCGGILLEPKAWNTDFLGAVSLHRHALPHEGSRSCRGSDIAESSAAEPDRVWHRHVRSGLLRTIHCHLCRCYVVFQRCPMVGKCVFSRRGLRPGQYREPLRPLSQLAASAAVEIGWR